MSIIESMRRRMMLAGEHDVPRDAFLDSEHQTAVRLQDSEIPGIQAIGREHTLAVMSLSREAGWPTSAFAGMGEVDAAEPRCSRRVRD